MYAMKQREPLGTDNSKSRNRLFRHLPPTAVPIKTRDLKQGISALWQPQKTTTQFQSRLNEWTGSPSCHLVSSGRAALTLILRGLKRRSQRTRVIIPAYSCPTVTQSVLQAGLEPVMCDVSPQTLDLDRQALTGLVDERVLAVVPVHLFGLAQDITDLLELGQQHDFYVIEDAAQAFGATFRGRMVGTWGDAGLYSLGRGKCIPTGHGGVIISQDGLDSDIAKIVAQSIKPSTSLDIRSLALFFGYGMAVRPLPWWFITRTSLNPAGAGMDVNALPPIQMTGFSATQAGIGASILERAKQTNAIRRRHARQLMSQLATFDFITFPQISPEAEPVFLRLPLVARNKEIADQLFQTLWEAGLGVSRSYTKTLPDLFASQLNLSIDKRSNFPGAKRLADCLLTLPTHSYMSDEDTLRIVKAFQTI
ncbi:MAG: hypothetical protein GY796_29890 [Chloroflexi bacterium]|nr:hypothetical protein [Chloroflexota bacterium]